MGEAQEPRYSEIDYNLIYIKFLGRHKKDLGKKKKPKTGMGGEKVLRFLSCKLPFPCIGVSISSLPGASKFRMVPYCNYDF